MRFLSVRLAACELRPAGLCPDTGLRRPRPRFHTMQVDNMFAPNHYESYCSALDKNVNCIGLLLVRG